MIHSQQWWKKILSSSILAVSFVALGLFVFYSIAPQNVAIHSSAKGVTNGPRTVGVRAVSPANLGDTLYSGTMDATIQDGQLFGDFKTPQPLKGRSFIVETCIPLEDDAGLLESCFAKTTDVQQPAVAYTCPYYVGEQRSSKIANILGQNNVEFDSTVLCGSEGAGGDTSAFGAPSKNSRLDIAAASATAGGVTYGASEGLVRRGGEIVALSFERLSQKFSSKLQVLHSKQLYSMLYLHRCRLGQILMRRP